MNSGDNSHQPSKQNEVRQENLERDVGGTMYIESSKDTFRRRRDTRQYVEDGHEQDDSQELAQQFFELEEKAKTEEMLFEAGTDGAMDRSCWDAVGLGPWRNKIWNVIRKAYPTKMDPRQLEHMPLKEVDNVEVHPCIPEYMERRDWQSMG